MAFSVVTAGHDEGPAPDPPPVSDAPAGSVLARLRERAAHQRRNQTLDLPVAGMWGDQLVIRYRMPPMDQADRLLAASARLAMADTGPTPSVSQTSIDLMATCCVTVLGRDQDGTLEDLHLGLTGQLLEMLGLPFPAGVDNPPDVTVGEVIGGLFDGNWVAVNVHAGQVMSWLGGEPAGGGGMGEENAGT